MTEKVWFYWQHKRLRKAGESEWTPCMTAENPNERALGGLKHVLAGLVYVDYAPLDVLAERYPPPEPGLAEAAGVSDSDATGLLLEGS